MYTSPSGSTIPIGTIIPEGLDRDQEAFSKVEKLAFSIKPRDGKIESGGYVAGCGTEYTNSVMTANFTVIESEAQPAAETPVDTPSLSVLPTATSTEPPKPGPVSGKIIFDYANTDSSRPGAGGELSRVTELCIPEISIRPDGNLSGQCEKLHITALLTDESFTTQVTGVVDAAGNITFSYDVSEIGTPNGTWRINYEGQGKVTSASEAAGAATFGYSCNSGAENLIWCWKWTSESFSGTIPWKFIPSQ
jgi:hypothetical protein